MSTGTNNLTEVSEGSPLVAVENVQYLVLLLIMVGQATCAVNMIAGQWVFLVANMVSIWRVFTLGRPLADRVKDIACLGLTVTILLLKFLQ